MNNKRKSNLSSVVLILAGGFILALAVLVFSRPTTVSGFGSFLTGFVEVKYPVIVNSRIDNCTLCHITTDPLVLNPYGIAFQQNGSSSAALTAIENLDSDNDGRTNLQEIQTHTFPGNVSDPAHVYFIPQERK